MKTKISSNIQSVNRDKIDTTKTHITRLPTVRLSPDTCYLQEVCIN